MDPYEKGLLKRVPCSKKTNILSTLVAIMDTEVERRGLRLIPSYTRVLLANEIHELIITDEKEAGPGKEVNSIGYLGFIELKKGGVIAVGDRVSLEGKVIGEIAGFDETHMPNHQNIIIKSERKVTGTGLNAQPGNRIVIG
ncbi:MAG: hypothetical protein U9O41_04080 [Candidatus Aerophobetes bacterium]|nr:hypothetical protein [Candidatus Aerophobetes bacterium]